MPRSPLPRAPARLPSPCLGESRAERERERLGFVGGERQQRGIRRFAWGFQGEREKMSFSRKPVSGGGARAQASAGTLRMAGSGTGRCWGLQGRVRGATGGGGSAGPGEALARARVCARVPSSSAFHPPSSPRPQRWWVRPALGDSSASPQLRGEACHPPGRWDLSGGDFQRSSRRARGEQWWGARPNQPRGAGSCRGAGEGPRFGHPWEPCGDSSGAPRGLRLQSSLPGARFAAPQEC